MLRFCCEPFSDYAASLDIFFTTRSLTAEVQAMKPGDDQDDPPSYAESTQRHEKAARNQTGQSSSADRAYSILTNYIVPHIQGASSSATASITIVLVPSNVVSLQPPREVDSKGLSEGFTGEQLIGFPNTEHLKLIRLSDPTDTVEFWQRSSSRQSLSDCLHAYLVQEGCYFSDDIARAESSQTQAGWMTVNGEELKHCEASITVLLQEVCLRIEDEMGLYETRRGKALVVKVNIGHEDHSLT